MKVQAIVRGFVVRARVVHRPRQEFLEFASNVDATLDVGAFVAAPSFAHGDSKLVLPRFVYPEGGDTVPPACGQALAEGDPELSAVPPPLLKELDDIDLWSTVDLEEELRAVRQRLAEAHLADAEQERHAGSASSSAPDSEPAARGEEEARLMGIWSSALEVMMVPKSEEGGATESIFFAPTPEAPTATCEEGTQVAAAATPLSLSAQTFGGRVRIFAMTAFDPPGVHRSLEDNSRANAALSAAIQSELDPKPTAVWRSFGFHLTEGWREDGFCLVYRCDGDAAADAAHWAAATAAVLALAARFDQGAIFFYKPQGDCEIPSLHERPSGYPSSFALLRTTLPCDKFSAEAETVVVRRVPPPGSSAKEALSRSQMELINRPWAGDGDFPVVC